MKAIKNTIKIVLLLALPLAGAAQRPPEMQTPEVQMPKTTLMANKQMFFETLNNKNTYALPIDRASVIGSYPLGVSQQKTVHIMFPSEIKEVDVGNRYVMVQITEAFNNVLRVKANAEENFSETNVTVICRDGSLYSFLTSYEDNPEVVNISIGNNAQSDAAISKALGINYTKQRVLDVSNDNFTETESMAQTALDKKPYIHNVGAYTMRVTALVQGIYTQGDNLYYVVKVDNRSEIDYTMAFAKVFVLDISEAKRVAVQEEELPIKYQLPTERIIAGGTEKTFTFVVPVRAISDSKQVDMEIYEADGARHLRFTIDRKLLQKAKKL